MPLPYRIPMAGSLTLALVLAAATPPASASEQEEDPVKLEDFDDDNDGRLSHTELSIFYLHQSSELHRLVDLSPRDGRISDEEVQAYKIKLGEQLDELREQQLDIADAVEEARLLDLTGASNVEDQSEAEQLSRSILDELGTPSTGILTAEEYFQQIPDPVPFTLFGDIVTVDNKDYFSGLLLRRSAINVTSAEESRLVSAFRKADPAVLSYSRDFDDQVDTFQFRGAFSYPLFHNPESGEWQAVVPKSDPEVNRTLAFIPSLTFDRVTSDDNNDANDTNSLIFRAGLEWEDGDVPDPLDLSRLHVNFSYATDFDLESQVLATEIDWEPVLLGLPGMRRGTQPGSLPVLVRWNMSVHTEAGYTIDAGGKTNLTDDDLFWRVGPRVQVEFFPSGAIFDRLKFRVAYQALAGIEGDPDSAELFEASMAFQLDDAGNFLLELAYQNGDTPLATDNVNLFSLSLGVKF